MLQIENHCKSRYVNHFLNTGCIEKVINRFVSRTQCIEFAVQAMSDNSKTKCSLDPLMFATLDQRKNRRYGEQLLYGFVTQYCAGLNLGSNLSLHSDHD